MGSTHILPVKSWVGHEYSLVSMDMPIPYPFILTCGPTHGAPTYAQGSVSAKELVDPTTPVIKPHTITRNPAVSIKCFLSNVLPMSVKL